MQHAPSYQRIGPQPASSFATEWPCIQVFDKVHTLRIAFKPCKFFFSALAETF